MAHVTILNTMFIRDVGKVQRVRHVLPSMTWYTVDTWVDNRWDTSRPLTEAESMDAYYQLIDEITYKHLTEGIVHENHE